MNSEEVQTEMRTPNRAKYPICVCICLALYYKILPYKYCSDGQITMGETETNKPTITLLTRMQSQNVPKYDMKYILVWPYEAPFDVLIQGQDSFINNDCKYINCYVTDDVKLFKDPGQFDAICFSGLNLRHLLKPPFEIRSSKQKYIFALLDPAPTIPITNPMFDNFFNWTWTYRLSSDISWRFVTVRDLNGEVVGPALNMKWPKYYKPISKGLKKNLKRKTKAIAWISPQFSTQSYVKDFLENFKVEIKKYNLTIDLYGKSGQFSCGKSIWCSKMLKRDYYFYFAFENSLDEDYVTEKLLIALNNFVVPVVYGGANYSRFLPPGSYLDAHKLGPIVLAKTINNAIKNLDVYYDFFRWKNYFKYDNAEATSELCNICTALNDEEKMKPSAIRNFRSWWNTPTRQRTYEHLLRNFFINKDLLKLASKFNGTREGSLVLWEHIKNQTNISKEAFIYVYNLNLLSVPSNSSVWNDTTEFSFTIPTYSYSFINTEGTETYDPRLEISEDQVEE